jgi:hypothetical protein
VERKVFSAPSRESNRQSLAYETSMVPQDHCQRTNSIYVWVSASQEKCLSARLARGKIQYYYFPFLPEQHSDLAAFM